MAVIARHIPVPMIFDLPTQAWIDKTQAVKLIGAVSSGAFNQQLIKGNETIKQNNQALFRQRKCVHSMHNPYKLLFID
ncbi:hypothetical protein [Nitrosomonas sp.]|uniref:hypothetical protein n=1 Tax=Nitrosomonas sp. TaxID=42353 RepID=UPI0032ECF01B